MANVPDSIRVGNHSRRVGRLKRIRGKTGNRHFVTEGYEGDKYVVFCGWASGLTRLWSDERVRLVGELGVGRFRRTFSISSISTSCSSSKSRIPVMAKPFQD